MTVLTGTQPRRNQNLMLFLSDQFSRLTLFQQALQDTLLFAKNCLGVLIYYLYFDAIMKERFRFEKTFCAFGTEGNPDQK